MKSADEIMKKVDSDYTEYSWNNAKVKKCIQKAKIDMAADAFWTLCAIIVIMFIIYLII